MSFIARVRVNKQIKVALHLKIILASQSPRRKEILRRLGIPFTALTAGTDETSGMEIFPEGGQRVRELARRKGADVLHLLHDDPDCLIISSDTLVNVDGALIGKPRNRADAARMLLSLGGRSSLVQSGICIHYAGRCFTRSSTTEVFFAPLSEEEINAYLDTPEPYDKAGAYAVQGLASVFVTGIHGDYDNVVGFPTRTFYEMLRDDCGLSLWDLREKSDENR